MVHVLHAKEVRLQVDSGDGEWRYTASFRHTKAVYGHDRNDENPVARPGTNVWYQDSLLDELSPPNRFGVKQERLVLRTGELAVLC